MGERVRKQRAQKLVSYLKRVYPKPKSELQYHAPFQFLVAVVLSAQCTDKVVNRTTEALFKKYKTTDDFARAQPRVLERELSSIPFFRNKTKAIIATAKSIRDEYGGRVPKTETELISLSGIGYKTAHVILGELYGVWEGIATDTHVKRFARKFGLTEHTDLKKISKDLERLVPKKDWKYVNNGFVLYGRYACPARLHECEQHPLTKLWQPAGKKWPRT
ncbi:MAG TPA: endonuclease III [Candidatus Paceibacterota bacterium]